MFGDFGTSWVWCLKVSDCDAAVCRCYFDTNVFCSHVFALCCSAMRAFPSRLRDGVKLKTTVLYHLTVNPPSGGFLTYGPTTCVQAILSHTNSGVVIGSVECCTTLKDNTGRTSDSNCQSSQVLLNRQVVKEYMCGLTTSSSIALLSQKDLPESEQGRL